MRAVRVGDFLIPVVITSVALSMVVPLPVAVLDFLIAGNLVLSAILLMSSLTVTRILDISSFPTLILLATLYRLSLNISTTRVILSEFRVGSIVDLLGAAITRGDALVGLVVFLVISVIQFIVIAKGAERVAEVSARFTLDALPGKQMSIDAELRSGVVGVSEAKQKRLDLESESRFYGALDGAMKFVKGDAIAGIIVVAINLLGAFFVGVFRRDLPVLVALEKASFMTIGDGLVSQVPALFTALAAGVVVTRVGSGQSSANDVFEQLVQSVGVQLGVGVCCLVLMFLPGVPALPFLVFGVALVLGAAVQRSKLDLLEEASGSKQEAVLLPVLEVVLPVSFEGQEERIRSFLDIFEKLRQKLFKSYGLLVPQPELSFDVNETASVVLRGDLLVELLPEEGEVFEAQQLARSVLERLAQTPDEFVDDVFSQALVNQYERVRPELIVRLVPEQCSVTDITVVLRSLVADGISIRNFDAILQAMAEAMPRCKNDMSGVIEVVRAALSRSISRSISLGADVVRVMTVNPSFEYRVFCADGEGGLLEDEEVADFCEFVAAHLEHTDLLVVSRGARRLLAQYVQGFNGVVRVFARDELQHIKMEVVAHYHGLAQLNEDVAA